MWRNFSMNLMNRWFERRRRRGRNESQQHRRLKKWHGIFCSALMPFWLLLLLTPTDFVCSLVYNGVHWVFTFLFGESNKNVTFNQIQTEQKKRKEEKTAVEGDINLSYIGTYSKFNYSVFAKKYRSWCCCCCFEPFSWITRERNRILYPTPPLALFDSRLYAL